MCLYAMANPKPMVSDKDITVYKMLRNKGGQFYTAFQMVPVALGGEMVADGETVCTGTVDVGAIHSYLSLPCAAQRPYFTVEATVKAGTPFWVSFDGKEIASKKLGLGTRNVCFPSEAHASHDAMEEVYGLARKMNTTKDGVAIGDVLLHDMETFISPGEAEPGMLPVGMVSFIKDDGTPHVISLSDCPEMPWFMHGDNRYSQLYGEAVADMSGNARTWFYPDRGGGLFREARAAINGLLPGMESRWYVPAAGEMLRTVRNMFVLEMAAEKLNKAVGAKAAYGLAGDAFYWSSTPCGVEYAWSVNTVAAELHYRRKHERRLVRPSLKVCQYRKKNTI